ncbi:MotA/TolQ/ExbB proton channel family protein [Orrella sp. 11846]|uniref:MotA/TolQ/ExbB proton channel family protein n=1 Tax=Orrella sp. 11846 TaxID=3409913 RepID=UPI003B5C0E7A
MEAHPDVWSILWQHTDIISKSLLLVLLVMSCMTWYLIFSKSLLLLKIRRRSKEFLTTFWNSGSLEQVENELIVHGVQDPFSHLTIHAIHARNHHTQYGATRLEEVGSTGEFLTRSMRKVIDEETSALENGLTVLATIGATAPFVGLFGTVWGVYHALMTIASADGASFNQLAGPVGEALIMTGLGLAVAIPAVLAYNALVRSNRVLLGKLDAFAHELFVFLTTGQTAGVTAKAQQIELILKGRH